MLAIHLEYTLASIKFALVANCSHIKLAPLVIYDGMGAQFGCRDENTGFLYLLGHRFYDAQFGQFMTRDPMGYGAG